MFAYQTMVLTNTGNQHLAVAIVAPGAGAALNSLLKYAVDAAGNLFTKPAGEESGSEGAKAVAPHPAAN